MTQKLNYRWTENPFSVRIGARKDSRASEGQSVSIVAGPRIPSRSDVHQSVSTDFPQVARDLNPSRFDPSWRRTLVLFFALTLSASAHPFKRDIAANGNQAYLQQDFPKAIAEYTKAQDLEPLSAEVRYNLGAAQFRQEEYDTALGEFTEATRADDPLMAAQAYYNLGNARYKKSKREFEAASVEAQGQPQAQEAAKNPVQEYVQKLENCIKDYEEALKRNPNDADAKYNLEVIRREIKNLMRRDPNQQQNQDQQQQQQNQDQQNQDQNQQQQNEQQQEQQQQNQDHENQEQEKQDQSKEGSEEATPTPQPQPQPGEATPTPGQAGQTSESEPSEAEPQPTQTLNISEEMARNILDNLPERRPRQSRQSRKNVEKDW